MCQGNYSHNIWGLGGVSFRRSSLEFGDRGGEGHFQPLGEASQAAWRRLRAHRFLPSPICHHCLRLKVSLPWVVGGPCKNCRFRFEVVYFEGKYQKRDFKKNSSTTPFYFLHFSTFQISPPNPCNLIISLIIFNITLVQIRFLKNRPSQRFVID